MSTTSSATHQRRGGRRSKLRRRVTGLTALLFALLATGGLYSAFSPEPQVAHAQEDPALVRKGEQIYNNGCITCHGSNLQGVQEHGPTLVGVGDAAVYFQVSTGRMPLARQGEDASRKQPRYNEDEIRALMAYVQAHGGGPQTPDASAEKLGSGDPARGGEIYRLNCASCHNFTGEGGALSSGKEAPTLDPANPHQIYTAMLSGPSNMPKFSDQQLTPQEKRDIITYIDSVTNNNNNVGGLGLGNVGPVSEGLIAFLVGIGVLVGITLWIGAKA